VFYLILKSKVGKKTQQIIYCLIYKLFQTYILSNKSFVVFFLDTLLLSINYFPSDLRIHTRTCKMLLRHRQRNK